MRPMTMKIGLSLVGLLALSACAAPEPKLMNIRSDTPDEFSIMPNRPLEEPDDFDTLPEPTPNGTSRAHVNPEADAIAALGGDPERLNSTRPNAGEGTLVAHAARYGANPNIREELAEEDLEFRRKFNGKLLERLFNRNTYYSTYSRDSLDEHLELDRLRNAGVATPSAPPDPERWY